MAMCDHTEDAFAAEPRLCGEPASFVLTFRRPIDGAARLATRCEAHRQVSSPASWFWTLVDASSEVDVLRAKVLQLEAEAARLRFVVGEVDDSPWASVPLDEFVAGTTYDREQAIQVLYGWKRKALRATTLLARKVDMPTSDVWRIVLSGEDLPLNESQPRPDEPCPDERSNERSNERPDRPDAGSQKVNTREVADAAERAAVALSTLSRILGVSMASADVDRVVERAVAATLDALDGLSTIAERAGMQRVARRARGEHQAVRASAAMWAATFPKEGSLGAALSRAFGDMRTLGRKAFAPTAKELGSAWDRWSMTIDP